MKTRSMRKMQNIDLTLKDYFHRMATFLQQTYLTMGMSPLLLCKAVSDNDDPFTIDHGLELSSVYFKQQYFEDLDSPKYFFFK